LAAQYEALSRVTKMPVLGRLNAASKNGNIATMKRKAFKKLVAAVRAARPKRRRPSLRLVVSNPKPNVIDVAAA
jgi:hypothetical protein